MLRLLLLFLLALFLLRALWRLIEGIAVGASGRAAPTGRGGPPSGEPMVRDPICGTFVVRARALTAGRGADTTYFCSEECRRKWKTARAV